MPVPTQLADGLWRFEDTCNVYVIQRGDRAIVVDFGSGAWMDHLRHLGTPSIDHVFLTHHHADQVSGLQDTVVRDKLGSPAIHASPSERQFLDPRMVRELTGPAAHLGTGCPASYDILAGGIPSIEYDMEGFTDLFWLSHRIRFVSTPGHGPGASTIILDLEGRQVAFCGDAIHAGGTIRQPYHLEWDHWTGSGALAAWEGVLRLQGLRIDLLCPSHGPVVENATTDLSLLAQRLLELYRAKGQIAPDEPDRYVSPDATGPGWRRYSPHLYQFGVNGYLLTSRSGASLIVDPTMGDLTALGRLLADQDLAPPSVACVSHYHADHCDAAPYLRDRYSTRVVLHPVVAAPLKDVAQVLPWQPRVSILADELWPSHGEWSWEEYEFRVAHWPGQTWYHCVFMADVDDSRVAFCGDSLQPPSRWNGTGGFCAYNRSALVRGFAASAELLQDWAPDIMAAGHTTVCRFESARMEKIRNWASRAERAIRALCPSGHLEQDYYFGDLPWTDGGITPERSEP